MQADNGISWKPGPIEGIDGAKRIEKPKIAQLGKAPEDSRFKELLEDIERLRIQGKKLSQEQEPSETNATSAKKGTEDLDQALDLADQTHETAMDMRRSLEDAFRRHMKS